ncbi:S1 RNA-binding domain-containing protein [Candidatus Uhrbacteria bacterium]|nr:S1 RNA-binding domain-containing protein [Candidatus Uhrbacteria bacterium]
MANSQLEQLLEDAQFVAIPKLGDLVKGKVLSTKGREVRIDVNGLAVGVVRGRELFTEAEVYKNLKAGDTVEATVVDAENENGEIELSFRYAGQKKAWSDLDDLQASGEPVNVKVLDANKGGLLVRVNHVQGFLPVSQLAPEHYPRVAGGDKQKILEKLKSFVGETMRVKILDVNESDEKLIVSEKAIWEDEQKNVIAQCRVGDSISGEVSAIADFGAFVKFYPKNATSPLEGLVHISEIAWQRIDHPKDVLKVGDSVRAEIIGIEGSKIFLSMKKLIEDPWKDVTKKYKVGEWVEGKVIKVNPFGFFVELDQDIQGLAHVSELADKPVEDVTKLGQVGDVKKFRIVSIEPAEHRLGLSLREERTEAEKAAETKE